MTATPTDDEDVLGCLRAAGVWVREQEHAPARLQARLEAAYAARQTAASRWGWLPVPAAVAAAVIGLAVWLSVPAVQPEAAPPLAGVRESTPRMVTPTVALAPSADVGVAVDARPRAATVVASVPDLAASSIKTAGGHAPEGAAVPSSSDDAVASAPSASTPTNNLTLPRLRLSVATTAPALPRAPASIQLPLVPVAMPGWSAALPSAPAPRAETETDS